MLLFMTTDIFPSQATYLFPVTGCSLPKVLQFLGSSPLFIFFQYIYKSCYVVLVILYSFCLFVILWTIKSFACLLFVALIIAWIVLSYNRRSSFTNRCISILRLVSSGKNTHNALYTKCHHQIIQYGINPWLPLLSAFHVHYKRRESGLKLAEHSSPHSSPSTPHFHLLVPSTFLFLPL